MLSPQKKKWKLCEGIDILTNPIVVIILQYISISNIMFYSLNLHNVIQVFPTIQKVQHSCETFHETKWHKAKKQSVTLAHSFANRCTK